jgi:hypothetical protein
MIRVAEMKLEKLLSLSFVAFLITFSVVKHSFAQSVSLVKGWNLLGNGLTTPLAVSSTFNDALNITSVWKWDSTNTVWSFYSPGYSDGGQAYAGTQG